MTVLVVGMHRSGTSALTGVLHSIGLPLGDESDLLPADRGNARGYFELLHVNQLNDEILNEWGGSWDTPPVFPADWLESGLAQRQVARIKRIIEQYGLTGAVIKDPRITIILPLWRRALGDEVVAVAMYRSPLEVAQSLSARSSDEFTLGLALWWEYNNAMVRDLGGIRTYLLSYDELTSAPINSSVAMAQQLHKWGVAVNLDAVHDAAGFIDQQLRRERTRATLGNECDELLAVLQAHHGGHPSWPTNETYTALAMPAALLQLRQASRDALVGQVAITNELQSATEELRATVDELNTQVHHWHDEFARVTREYAVLETTTSKRIAHLEQRLSLRLGDFVVARPFVLWFTGLSGAGKTTIATNVAERLAARGVEVVALDADVLRQSISQDLGYDDESRKEQARRISALAGAHVADGHSCIVAAITPFEESRLHARDTLGDNTYVEVFVDTPLSVAETRDPKGLYKKARAGEISNFTGISSVFERPNHSNVVIDTTAIDIETATNLVLAYLSAHDFIGES